MFERGTLTLGGTTTDIDFCLDHGWLRSCVVCDNLCGRTVIVAQPVIVEKSNELTMMSGDGAKRFIINTFTDLVQTGQPALCSDLKCWRQFAESLKKKGLVWTPLKVLKHQRRCCELGISIPTDGRRLSKSLRKHIRLLKAKRHHASTHGPRMSEARRWLTSHGYALPVLPPHPSRVARRQREMGHLRDFSEVRRPTKRLAPWVFGWT